MTNGGMSLMNGFMVWLNNVPCARMPDGIFLRPENMYRLHDTFVDGAVDVAVEVVALDTYERDFELKLHEYCKGGIPEYWIIDPIRKIARFYQLKSDGQYKEVTFDEEGHYCSVQIDGFWLKPDWLWQQPRISITNALLEIGGQDYRNYLADVLLQKGLELIPNA
jgi:Uma2 family endonuclease